jgi:CRISPR-associated endonuclease/helicase Cas3
MSNESINFDHMFTVLTGNSPFPWQQELYRQFAIGSFPSSCNLPTGLGKTSVIAIWLIALMNHPDKMPRRLVYVVNRRTVVDQTTTEVERLRENLPKLNSTFGELAISTLRGQFADNREWSADPSRPAVICGTVDMIGSRLLFSGYGVGFKARPLHAGFLGQDVLLVHDEAHLEPAFQQLLIEIENEQRHGRFPDRHPLRVMELSATSRGHGEVFKLTPADEADDFVKQRIHAKKTMTFHSIDDEKKQLADKLVELAIVHKDSQGAILIFVRTVDDLVKVVAELRKEKQNVQQLTGTMRGLERDRMTDPRKKEACPIFARFMRPPNADAPDSERWKVDPKPGTVYLVCTSAGEVGVNISADHLVCDLSPFDSMAQRFGRVNRFGLRDDTRIDIVHLTAFKEDNKIDQRRAKTLILLKTLNGNGSPTVLGELKLEDRLAAFSPQPTILPVSDILFDAWALTTIRDKLPGRPPVAEYLHGVSDWEPPQTKVAWRTEVDAITGELLERYKPEDLVDAITGELLERYKPEDLLDEYPLKPHELLGDRSDRVHKELVKLAERFPNTPTWIIDESGKVTPTPFDIIAEKTGKELIERKTVLLPHHVGGLTKQGLLDGSYPPPTKKDEPPVVINNDVADALVNEQRLPIRLRVWDDDPDFDTKAEGMRLILRIDFPPSEENEDEKQSSWHWFERPIPRENSKNAKEPVLLDDHVTDVVRNLVDEKEKGILSRLTLDLDPERDAMFKKVILVAAKFHDLGKKRELWQRSIGRPARLAHLWFGKSGRRWRPRDIAEYRHEFGSLIDLQNEEAFKSLDDESKDLVQHLIATHHGQGRPHFTSAQTIDPNSTTAVCDAIAIEVPRRYARLQRKFGRWGLAYIESLLRAADYAASAVPSAFFTEEAK